MTIRRLMCLVAAVAVILGGVITGYRWERHRDLAVSHQNHRLGYLSQAGFYRARADEAAREGDETLAGILGAEVRDYEAAAEREGRERERCESAMRRLWLPGGG